MDQNQFEALIEMLSGEEDVASFVSRFLESVRRWMGTTQCVIYLFDKDRDGFVTGHSSTCFIRSSDVRVRKILNSPRAMLGEATVDENFILAPLEIAFRNVTVLSVRIRSGTFNYGILEAYQELNGSFDERHEAMLTLLGQVASLGVRNLRRREKRFLLAQTTERLGGQTTVDGLLDVLCQDIPKLVDCKRVAIAQLDPQTSILEVKNFSTPPDIKAGSLHGGDGVYWRAMEEKKEQQYVAQGRSLEETTLLWNNSVSALAIPLLVHSVILEDQSNTRKNVAVGVICVESPAQSAFTQFDVDLLKALAAPAALSLLRLSIEAKFKLLRDAETRLLGIRRENEILNILAEEVINTLGFEHLNISLVDFSAGRINSKCVKGGYIPEADAARFMSMASHCTHAEPTPNEDIQSWVVREKRIIVPPENSKYFDEAIHHEFHLSGLIRVYVPMIVAIDGNAIGTVEAGYRRANLPQIFDRDVQILKQFVDHATAVIDQSRKLKIAEIVHELKSPLIGIKNNAEFLDLHLGGGRITPFTESRLLSGIVTDCMTSLAQVGRLAHLYGGPPVEERVAESLVMQEIVFKTLFSMAPKFKDRKIVFKTQVSFDKKDGTRVIAMVDRSRINQVFFNIIDNAIKYGGERREFKLKVEVRETHEYWVISVSDNGIGVETEFTDRIFEEGFRSPNVRSLNITGTGVGLPLARRIMRDMGGDLVLASNEKPTVFDVFLPKSPKTGVNHENIRT